MKKLISLVFVLVLIFALVGCTGASSDNETTSDRFVRVYSEYSSCIYVDSETNVMYFWHSGVYSGGLSVMLDENGDPLLWGGD